MYIYFTWKLSRCSKICANIHLSVKNPVPIRDWMIFVNPFDIKFCIVNNAIDETYFKTYVSVTIARSAIST